MQRHGFDHIGIFDVELLLCMHNGLCGVLGWVVDNFDNIGIRDLKLYFTGFTSIILPLTGNGFTSSDSFKIN